LRGLFAAALPIALLVATAATGAKEQAKESGGVTNIVLVHGAWADGSSWSKVIPLLEARGFQVTAVQIPLTSLADDVATVQRAIALENGPILLVAHSYGGVVITQAGNDPKVAGLVYVAAFAPAEGQSAFDLANANPTPVLQELRQDQFGFLKITPTGIREDFAQDLSAAEQALLTATQTPTAGGAALSAPVTTAAWRNKPSWFVVAAHDRVISPTLQATLAQQMNATTITLSSSHVAMLSRPYAVASFIRRAARGDR
jgi:pimeloyl-ACP methyl ester carboxylesterase